MAEVKLSPQEFHQKWLDNTLANDVFIKELQSSSLERCNLQSLSALQQHVTSLSQRQFHAMWSFYDTENEGLLTREKSRLLTEKLYARIPVIFRELVARANPGMRKADTDALVMRELPHLLPGTVQKTVNHFVDTLLTPNVDGLYSAYDFISKWNKCAYTMLQADSAQLLQKNDVLVCNIL